MFTIGRGLIFVAGTAFGSLGLKLLKSKDAKKVYAHTVATALRAKDSIMEMVSLAGENVEDILAEAKDINEKRIIKEEILEVNEG